jgi:guanine deaminase
MTAPPTARAPTCSISPPTAGLGRHDRAGRALAARPLAAGGRRRPHRRRAGLTHRGPVVAAPRSPRPAADARLHRHPRAQPAARRDRQLRHRTAGLARTPTPSRPNAPGPTRGGDAGADSSGRAAGAWHHGGVVFPTVHKESGRRPLHRGAAARHAPDRRQGADGPPRPDGLRDDVARAERDCIDLIRAGMAAAAAYAVTVRFAPTSTPEQLAMAGALCRADPGLYMQTHVAENRAEVRWVAELFPEARSYLDVYARQGLLHARVLAHGIWLDAADRAALRDERCADRLQPQFQPVPRQRPVRLARARGAAGVPVSVASDVGGGTSLSMLRTLADAYKVQAMGGQRLPPGRRCTPPPAAPRRRCTWPRDRLLRHRLPGRPALWRWAAGPVATVRDAAARSLHERVFAWMTLADERNLVATWVAGTRTTSHPDGDRRMTAPPRLELKHQQAVPRREGQRRRQPAREARRDPRRARRKRRRQEHADEDRLRRRAARRGRWPGTAAGVGPQPARGAAHWASAWCSSTSACSTR